LAKAKELTPLVPQKGGFKLRGKINGMGSKFFFKEGVGESGKEWKSINFSIETSNDNKVFVGVFDTEKDYAYAYKKPAKGEKKGTTKKIAWKDRNDKLPNGFKIIQPAWDLIDEIIDNFADDVRVMCLGEIRYSEYNDEPQVNLGIKKIYEETEPMDFDDPDFKEVSTFRQEMTVVEVNEIKDDDGKKKLAITAYIIQGRGKDKDGVERLPDVQTAVFYVNLTEKNKKFYANVKKLKFGDTFEVSGIIQSRTEKSVVSDEESDDAWGEVEEKVITKLIKEFEITGIYKESFVSKMYKPEDFEEALSTKQAKEDFDVDENDDDDENENSEFGETNQDDDLDLSESDIPF